MTEATPAELAAVDQAPESGASLGYWHELLPETETAGFLDVTPRALQSWRQRGCGPPFVRISARCVKYTRFRCKIWYDERMRISTSDPGTEVA